MNQGIPILLTKIKTSDGITLEGIYAAPKRKRGIALIWLHGLSSRFSSGQPLIQALSRRLAHAGIAYLKCNTRGHDIVAHGKKTPIGTAFEKFEECVYDIRAMIQFARRLGYKHIVLAGHSTGANKALYYLYKTRDKRIKGLLLLGPASDIAYDYMTLGKKEIRQRVALAKRIQKKHPLQLLPEKFGIWTARRYVSILDEGRPEDAFPYYNPKAKWRALGSVTVPLGIMIGSRDEYLDRTAKNAIEIFRARATRTREFSGIIIKGARHGFAKKEKELSREIVRWIKKAVTH